MIRCDSCGEENPPRARYCSACAAPVGPSEAVRESRRVVTVLFADIVGSTTIGERLDSEIFRNLQGRYFAALRQVIERHGGTVEKFIGDAVMAVFGLPVLHEDDALRAVRAAAELAPALEGLDAELQERHGMRLELRVGVHTGEVVAADSADRQAMVSGDTINTAARLEAAAQPGEILLGPLTHELVRDAITAESLEGLALRGRDGPVTAHRLLAITGTEAHARRMDTPLVGRSSELATLRTAFERALDGPGCELVTIVASAGTGKSRLVREFLATVEDRATILRGHCLNYGDGITYWALGEILRGAARVDESDDVATLRAKLDDLVTTDTEATRVAGVLASVLGVASDPASSDDIAWAVRRVLALVAAQRPLVVLVEDIHWAEPALLDLVESVVDWSPAVPIVLVCPARPEILETRTDWVGGRPNATTLDLEPLDASLASALIDVLPGGTALPGDLRRQVLDAAEGNPLFVEELMAMLVDEGHLQPGADDTWMAAMSIGDVRVPPSISLLLAARLDSLETGERRVAQRAAVVGRVFERAAVAELSPAPERDALGLRLLSLTRRQVIHPDAPGLDGDDAYRFRHVLIRDAAYEALTKAERADLHERFARWLERAVGGRINEYIEISAHHFAQAAEYRTALATIDERPGLAGEAVKRLIAAADRAERIGVHLEASRLLLRAGALIESGDGRIDARRSPILERAARDLDLGGDPVASLTLAQGLLDEGSDPDDPAAMPRLHAVAARAAFALGDDGAMEAHVAAAIATLGDDVAPAQRADILARLARQAMVVERYGESETLCRLALSLPGAAPEVAAGAHVTLASDLASSGRFDEAERHFELGRSLALSSHAWEVLARWYTNRSIMLAEADGLAAGDALLREGAEWIQRAGLDTTAFGSSVLLNAAIHEVDRGSPSFAAELAGAVLGSGGSGWDPLESTCRHASLSIL